MLGQCFFCRRGLEFRGGVRVDMIDGRVQNKENLKWLRKSMGSSEHYRTECS